jgi:hypothetical protein
VRSAKGGGGHARAAGHVARFECLGTTSDARQEMHRPVAKLRLPANKLEVMCSVDALAGQLLCMSLIRSYAEAARSDALPPPNTPVGGGEIKGPPKFTLIFFFPEHTHTHSQLRRHTMASPGAGNKLTERR